MLLSQGINVVRALEARGIDAAPLLRQAGCAPALFHVPETRVPNRVVQRVFELAKQATGDPCFGLDVGEQVRGVALHAVGYAWLASATLSARCPGWRGICADGSAVEEDHEPSRALRSFSWVGPASELLCCRFRRRPPPQRLCALPLR